MERKRKSKWRRSKRSSEDGQIQEDIIFNYFLQTSDCGGDHVAQNTSIDIATLNTQGCKSHYQHRSQVKQLTIAFIMTKEPVKNKEKENK